MAVVNYQAQAEVVEAEVGEKPAAERSPREVGGADPRAAAIDAITIRVYRQAEAKVAVTMQGEQLIPAGLQSVLGAVEPRAATKWAGGPVRIHNQSDAG